MVLARQTEQEESQELIKIGLRPLRGKLFGGGGAVGTWGNECVYCGSFWQLEIKPQHWENCKNPHVSADRKFLKVQQPSHDDNGKPIINETVNSIIPHGDEADEHFELMKKANAYYNKKEKVEKPVVIMERQVEYL